MPAPPAEQAADQAATTAPCRLGEYPSTKRRHEPAEPGPPRRARAAVGLWLLLAQARPAWPEPAPNRARPHRGGRRGDACRHRRWPLLPAEEASAMGARDGH